MAISVPGDILRVRLEIETTGERRRDTARSATLSIENNTEKPLRISRVKYLLPPGVSLVPVAGNSYLRHEQTYRNLCRELRTLIQDEYFFSNPELIAARKKMVIQLINEAIIAAPGPGLISKIFRVWQIILSPMLAVAAFGRFQDRYNASGIVIEDYKNARIAWELVTRLPVPEEERGGRNRDLIALKLDQLKKLEDERVSPVSRQWTVESHSVHSEALILKCEKGLLSVRRYPIVIEITTAPAEDRPPITKRVSSSIEVPPSDIALAVLAMICAPIGLIARLVVQDPQAPARVILERASTPQILIASLLGFVLCIMLERIQWGKSAQLSLNWRTAVFLGFGAGVGTQNLLKAIQAFFGIP
jgi:hypothetical protein